MQDLRKWEHAIALIGILRPIERRMFKFLQDDKKSLGDQTKTVTVVENLSGNDTPAVSGAKGSSRVSADKGKRSGPGNSHSGGSSLGGSSHCVPCAVALPSHRSYLHSGSGFKPKSVVPRSILFALFILLFALLPLMAASSSVKEQAEGFADPLEAGEADYTQEGEPTGDRGEASTGWGPAGVTVVDDSYEDQLEKAPTEHERGQGRERHGRV